MPTDGWAGIASESATDGRSECAAVPPSSLRIPPDAHRRVRDTRRYLAMAALLTLVTAGVVYVAPVARRVRLPSPATDAAQHAAPAIGRRACPRAERSADAAFAALSEQHFERSKLVVLGLANKDPHGAPARPTGRTSAGSRRTC